MSTTTVFDKQQDTESGGAPGHQGGAASPSLSADMSHNRDMFELMDIEDTFDFYDALNAHSENCSVCAKATKAWSITGKERNRAQHALNGNSASLPTPLPFSGISLREATETSLDDVWKAIAYSDWTVPPEEMLPLLSAGNTRQGRKKGVAKKGKKKEGKKGGQRKVRTQTAPLRSFRQTINKDTSTAGVPVGHTSILAPATAPAVVGGFECWEVQINPGLGHVFPFLSGISASYVYYVVNSISVEYVKEVGEQDGLVRMAFAYKTDQPKPVTDAEFSEVSGSTKGAPWINQTIRANPSRVHTLAKKLKVRKSHENNLSSYDGLKFWYAFNYCPVASKHLGHFYVTYNFTFYEARGLATQGSLTSGDQVVYCSNVDSLTVEPTYYAYCHYNVPEMHNIAGMTVLLEKSTTATDDQDVTVFRVDRPMSVEVTTTTTAASSVGSAVVGSPSFLSTSGRFLYTADGTEVGAADQALASTNTQMAAASDLADGSGIVATRSAIHTHHSKARIHMVPGFKYFMSMLNDSTSKLDMFLNNFVRVANITLTFVGSLEHILSHISPEEEKSFTALRGPLVHPTDPRGPQERRRRLLEGRTAHFIGEKKGFTAPFTDGKTPHFPIDKEDERRVTDAAESPTSTFAPPTSDASVDRDLYKEKVLKFNKLQAELDELEKVGSASLNC